MHKYIPNTQKEKQEMLTALGLDSIEELFHDIPEDIKFKKSLSIGEAMSELEINRHMSRLSEKNRSTDDLTCFLGAGAYDHFIPSVVKNLASRSEFYTSYTPYQAEISQGTLRAIYEYQTMIADLTGMDVSNASLYDGQTAAVEAAFMAINRTRKNKLVVSKSVHPETLKVLKTYLEPHGTEIIEIPLYNGATDLEKLNEAVDKETAGVIVQSPNFFGIIEDLEAMKKSTKKTRALYITSVDPIALGILKKPGEIGADIAIGDAQALGNDLNFGGPFLGFIATTSKLVRKLPGRIVGETVDADGHKAYVLTLQTREQHIRREKATSNICSNQGLNALMATIYLSTVGKNGLKEIATDCLKKAHYAYQQISELDGYSPTFKGQPFFKEFSITSETPVNAVNDALLSQDILGGYPLEEDFGSLENASLYCVTEKRSKEEIDALVKQLELIHNG